MTSIASTRAKPRHLESLEQRALVEWAALQVNAIPQLRMLVAVPNGGVRSKVEAAIMKAEGVRKGFPDLMLASPMRLRGYAGLFIEMKQKDGVVDDDQTWWLRQLRAEGYCAMAAFGWDQARAIIIDYLSGNFSYDDWKWKLGDKRT